MRRILASIVLVLALVLMPMALVTIGASQAAWADGGE